MRIGGLASGIDTDELIKKLMTAERLPLDKMQQNKQTLTWKRDSLRDINKSLKELDTLLKDMKISSKYKPTTITSSIESAVTATGGKNNTSYEIGVSQLASRAINTSTERIGFDGKKTTDPISSIFTGTNKTVEFTIYDKDGKPQPEPYKFEITDDDTLESVFEKIKASSNGEVTAFYDATSDRVFMQRTKMGQYNKGEGPEIDFSNDPSGFFTNTLKMDQTKETGGTDAIFTYNGVELSSKTNSYQIDGLNLQFNDKTDGKTAKLVVQHDTDKAFDNVMEFINKYNEIVEKLNKSQQEEKYRNFPPLTEEQKKDMTENQIKQWEEKSKSGLLRGDSIITGALNEMRIAMYKKVNTNGEYSVLTQIGLQTSANYMDGGKIVLEKNSDSKLKEALEKDPESVYKLFVGEGDTEGLLQGLEKSIGGATGRINERAGKSTATTLENDTLGKNMKAMDKSISDFERRLVQKETRYWNQFNAMEKAINRLNSQSAQMLSQFGG